MAVVSNVTDLIASALQLKTVAVTSHYLQKCESLVLMQELYFLLIVVVVVVVAKVASRTSSILNIYIAFTMDPIAYRCIN